jgi:NADP-dependent aldehyde dehydrogenase
MGSTNPVVFLPDAVKTNSKSLASLFASSITVGMGQFCTNPGLMFAMENDSLDDFLRLLHDEVVKVVPARMLHAGIHKGYNEKMEKSFSQKGVQLVGRSAVAPADLEALPSIATVTADVFLKNPLLHEEVFGPYSLMVKCADANQLKQAWTSVAGQLTTTLVATDKDFSDHSDLVEMAPAIAGRIVFNGVPTGVEVCPSMFHGGPFPATTDSRFTSVGIHAVKRWVRPICYQNSPDYLLPAELKNRNVTGIWRLVNNELTKADVG